MSNAKLIVGVVVGMTTLAGIITAKWLQGRSNRKIATNTAHDLLKQQPDMCVRIMKNKLEHLREEGASEAEIAAAQLRLAQLEQHCAEQDLANTQKAGEIVDQRLSQSMDRLRDHAKNKSTLQ